MPTGHFITDEQWKLICHMQDGPVLNVGSASNLNGMNIGPHHHLIPDTRVFADGDCSHQTCGRATKAVRRWRAGTPSIPPAGYEHRAIPSSIFFRSIMLSKSELAEIFGKNCASRLTNLANSVDKGTNEGVCSRIGSGKGSEAIACRASPSAFHEQSRVS